MEAVVLAGLAMRVLDELMKNPYRTIELRGARNVRAVEEAEEAEEMLFMTYEPFNDVRRGTEGLIAKLLEMNELDTRIPWEASDEREITVCRAKVRLIGLGRVVEVERGRVVRVRIRELMPHEMGIS